MKNRTLTAALLASTALTLAACGGGSTASNSPGQPAGTTGTRPAGASTHPVSSRGQSIDVCAALPAAAASQITGISFTTTKASSVEHVVFGCDYSGPSSALLQISVATQAGKLAFSSDVAALKAVNHPPVLVSGVGDEAFSEPDPQGNAGSAGAAAFASYGAVFGDTYIKIGGLTYVTADQGKQIVEQLDIKL
ncbi:MAG TPA: hypothetical protein VMU94_04540 [Streptosporangiaceae bacterium]|nr:hypothetical protein [Streptosporangiaceae bacterium]